MSPLVIALPSKGRLKKRVESLFSNCGLTCQSGKDERSYFGQLSGFKNEQIAEIVYLSAGDIARELGTGSIHLGITGEDLVRETLDLFNQKVSRLHALNFGHADVVVGVPESWIDVHCMADLDDVAASFRRLYGRCLRVATKYWNLTHAFFVHHGLDTYRIVESLGATEGAPAAGHADIIVDITSTGATLRANHLKILQDGVILKSQACLFGSKTVQWHHPHLALAIELLSNLTADTDLNSIDKLSHQLCCGKRDVLR